MRLVYRRMCQLGRKVTQKDYDNKTDFLLLFLKKEGGRQRTALHVLVVAPLAPISRQM